MQLTIDRSLAALRNTYKSFLACQTITSLGQKDNIYEDDKFDFLEAMNRASKFDHRRMLLSRKIGAPQTRARK
jgi:hypothetical protein